VRYKEGVQNDKISILGILEIFMYKLDETRINFWWKCDTFI